LAWTGGAITLTLCRFDVHAKCSAGVDVHAKLTVTMRWLIAVVVFVCCSLPGSNAGTTIIVETQHPYLNSVEMSWRIQSPGATSTTKYTITFDENTFLEKDKDSLIFYKDESRTEAWTVQPLTGKDFAPLTVHGAFFIVVFRSDEVNQEWGVRMSIADDSIYNVVYKPVLIMKVDSHQDALDGVFLSARD
jgi:hypothetical protein